MWANLSAAAPALVLGFVFCSLCSLFSAVRAWLIDWRNRKGCCVIMLLWLYKQVLYILNIMKVGDSPVAFANRSDDSKNGGILLFILRVQVLWRNFRSAVQKRFNLSSAAFSFGSYVVAIFLVYLYWGYLQEKLTSTSYISMLSKSVVIEKVPEKTAALGELQVPIETDRAVSDTCSWQCPVFLNACLSMFASATAFIVQYYGILGVTKPMSQSPSTTNKAALPSVYIYWKSALSMAVASPIGYKALNYITYPMMILTKSAKAIPVMLIGVVFYQRKYPWYKYVMIAMLCSGVALYSYFSADAVDADVDSIPNSNSSKTSTSSLLTGMFLIGVHLSLEGFTNNDQDKIFSNYNVSPLEMMKSLPHGLVVCNGCFLDHR